MLHVDSEAGVLRQAILHRPGLELTRLSPTNHDEYLFDDVLWVKKAKEEHDAFAETLREAGVRVHYLDQLLRETLAIPEARKYVLESSFDERIYGPLATDALYQAFAEFDDDDTGRPPHRRHHQAGDARAGGGPELGGLRLPRPRRLAAPALAQPPVHPGHLVLDLRRRGDQLHAQEGPHARDRALRGDLPLAPAVRDGGFHVWSEGSRTGRPPPRAATCTSSATARCWSA